ncbi:hypothetical protein MMC12_008182, partial [Toensbergia leucococca]|nr:hypothetical protein [Toensbergia leucococca]
MADTLHQYYEVRGFYHSKNEVPVSKGPTEAASSLPPDYLASSQARTLPSIRSFMPTTASENVVQRIRAAPNVPGRPSQPSEQAHQPGLRPVRLHNILNPVKVEDHVNTNEHDNLALPFLRSPPRHQQIQETPSSQMQTSQSPAGVNLAPQQPISWSDSSSTHHSGSDKVRHTEPALAPPVAFPSQSQPPLLNSFLPPYYTSTVSQMGFDNESQHQMTIIDTGSGFHYVPVDAQIASKAADEKRKRNATASHRFRQRRKEKEEESAEKVSNMEQRIRELEGENDFLRVERDFYRGERNFFRNAATHTSSQAPFLPRPLSPRQR